MDIVVEDLSAQESQQAPSTRSDNEAVAHLSVARHFNIDVATKEEDGKLREIWDHARALSPSGEITDVIWQILHLERTLGAPKLGESSLDKLYRWAKLKRQESEIQRDLMNV